MEFGRRHDTTDFCPRQRVTDFNCRLSCGLVGDLVRGNWCNEFWPSGSRRQWLLSAERLLFCHPAVSVVLDKLFQLGYIPDGFPYSFTVPNVHT